MSTETKISVSFDTANVRERSDVMQRFHRKRLYWKGQRLLNKALLFAFLSAAVAMASACELVDAWLGELGSFSLCCIACYYFGRFRENASQLNGQHKRKE